MHRLRNALDPFLPVSPWHRNFDSARDERQRFLHQELSRDLRCIDIGMIIVGAVILGICMLAGWL